MKQLFTLLLTPFLLNAQIQYSGSIHPYDLYRISDGSEISLPFRVAELELGYTRKNIDFKMNSALEYRWLTAEYTLDLREAYLVWYPHFGEVRLGKQVFAWGAVDANNPTDNVSAYDYYYLFLPGTERKIGSLSAAVDIYLGNWQIEAVVIPEHRENRLPFDEPDFPIAPPVNPTEDQFLDIENPMELGVRVQTSIFQSDISVSYFKGHDRMFSLVGVAPWESRVPDQQKFGYLHTDVIGADIVSFVGDFTMRAEGGYFRTSNGYNELDFMKLDINAEYSQYVFQLEYSAPLDIQLMGQLIGSSVHKAEGLTFDTNLIKRVSLNRDNFHPGMGTPFAMFVDRALLLSATGTLIDDRVELTGNVFMNLEETGYMIGLGASYSPIENWRIELGGNKFIGKGGSDGDNIFNQLEDFSHVMIGLKYSF